MGTYQQGVQVCKTFYDWSNFKELLTFDAFNLFLNGGSAALLSTGIFPDSSSGQSVAILDDICHFRFPSNISSSFSCCANDKYHPVPGHAFPPTLLYPL